MATAKDLIVKPIKSADAIAFVKAHHYSGQGAINANVHLGAFLDGRLHGVMQFGSSLAKHKIQGLVSGTQWHEFLELNRMAFDDVLPRNSESRALSIAWRLFRKNAPQVKWVVSFADGTQCGDGTIYRAAGFVLTGVNKNSTMWKMPDGFIFADIGLRASSSLLRKKVGYKLGENFSTFKQRVGCVKVEGFQLRYIYFIDPTYRARLTVPELPYDTIAKMGAKMYKGQRPTGESGEIDNAQQTNAEIGDASSTVSLSLEGTE